MNKKINSIKLVMLISILLISFSLFLYFIFKEYSYEKQYVINKFKITEKYNKKSNYYVFNIEYNNINYPYIFKHKYIKKRELIKDIKSYSNDLETCIIPTSDKISFYPLCSKDKEIYTINLSNINDIPYKYKNTKIINEEYNKIYINVLNDNSYLLYNYKGFYLISNDMKKEIELFTKDIYSIDLVYQIDNYLVLPDYNQSYFFDKIYLINIDNGKVKEINMDYKISFDSVFLGDYKNKVYLLDKKNEQEYTINIKKNKIEEIDFLILNNNKLEKTTYRDIVNNNLSFKNNIVYTYKIIDNNLYKIINNTKIKLSNREVTEIIKNDDENVYYLSKDNLYMYNNIYGEILLLTNFEWNFNNTNMIYIYK